jgi:hypothetical protein
MEFADELESIAEQIRSGDYTIPCEVILLTRSAETDIMTIHRWGEVTGLLEAAYLCKRPSA